MKNRAKLTNQDIDALREEALAEDTMQPPKPFVIEPIDNIDIDNIDDLLINCS